MISFIKRFVWSLFIAIDPILKFSNLKNGGIGIQLGFDMNAPMTTDVFLMYERVKPDGMVLAIDADPRNIVKADELLMKEKKTITLIHKAVFSEKGKVELMLGESASWNQLNNIPIDSTVRFVNEKLQVDMDSLDNIVEDLNIDIKKSVI